jgi:hypothetical protein
MSITRDISVRNLKLLKERKGEGEAETSKKEGERRTHSPLRMPPTRRGERESERGRQTDTVPYVCLKLYEAFSY